MDRGMNSWVALGLVLFMTGMGIAIGVSMGKSPGDWELPDSYYYDIRLVEVKGGEYIFEYTLEPTPARYITKVMWYFKVENLDQVRETPFEMFQEDRVFSTGQGYELNTEYLKDFEEGKIDFNTVTFDEKYSNKRK